MKTYEVKFKMLVIGQQPNIRVYAVAAPTADKARANSLGPVVQ